MVTRVTNTKYILRSLQCTRKIFEIYPFQS